MLKIAKKEIARSPKVVSCRKNLERTYSSLSRLYRERCQTSYCSEASLYAKEYARRHSYAKKGEDWDE